MKIRIASTLIALMVSVTGWGATQCVAAPPADGAQADGAQADAGDQKADTQQQMLFKQFEDKLSNVKLVGNFTILGKEGPLRKEEYTIRSVKKLPQGDTWAFTTRIKYGDKDVEVPLPLDVQWAGTTPVITLTDFTIPGMGTFSARVVIYRNKYAGTWSHGEVGGHLFGTIEKESAEDETE